MAKLVIQTQVFENYGAHAWDGEGDCPQYWKAKGSDEYVLPNFTDFTNTASVVEALRPQVEANDHWWREAIVSWSVIGDDELTQWEKDQLEFQGKITSLSKTLPL
jgi:hypothetical protein